MSNSEEKKYEQRIAIALSMAKKKEKKYSSLGEKEYAESAIGRFLARDAYKKRNLKGPLNVHSGKEIIHKDGTSEFSGPGTKDIYYRRGSKNVKRPINT